MNSLRETFEFCIRLTRSAASNAKRSLTSWWTTITPEITARQNNNDCVSNCGTGNSNGGSNNNVGNGSSGTSTTDRNIALGIGLGVGLPGAIVATYQILKYLSKKKEEENQDLKQQNARNGGLTAGQHQQQYAQQIGSFGGPRAQGAAELGN